MSPSPSPPTNLPPILPLRSSPFTQPQLNYLRSFTSNFSTPELLSPTLTSTFNVHFRTFFSPYTLLSSLVPYLSSPTKEQVLGRCIALQANQNAIHDRGQKLTLSKVMRRANMVQSPLREVQTTDIDAEEQEGRHQLPRPPHSPFTFPASSFATILTRVQVAFLRGITAGFTQNLHGKSLVNIFNSRFHTEFTEASLIEVLIPHVPDSKTRDRLVRYLSRLDLEDTAEAGSGAGTDSSTSSLPPSSLESGQLAFLRGLTADFTQNLNGRILIDIFNSRFQTIYTEAGLLEALTPHISDQETRKRLSCQLDSARARKGPVSATAPVSTEDDPILSISVAQITPGLTAEQLEFLEQLDGQRTGSRRRRTEHVNEAFNQRFGTSYAGWELIDLLIEAVERRIEGL